MPSPTIVPPSLKEQHRAINLRLSLLGCPTVDNAFDAAITALAAPIFARYRETTRQLIDPLCPADHRIQTWLDRHLGDAGGAPRLPARSFVLDQPGLARTLSLPADGDEFTSPLVKSYRVRQGVLHNPANDRRTTKGVFHIAEGGLPIPDDKLAVPKTTFAKMLALALQPPRELMRLPFTANRGARQAECFVSQYIRPLVCPEVPGFIETKSLEIRFLAPGSLVSNLDFIEGIFGNAGDPFLPENDAALDIDHWTGHTGCVILAPHLTTVPKHLAGLPHWDLATPRQRRDGMCWKDKNELYNGGSAFKLTARDHHGVMLTLIADNYYGYCKKEVKTQISFSANLYGLAEEEHAGGALVFPSYDLGDEFSGFTDPQPQPLADVTARFGDRFALQPEGHALDTRHPEIILVPELTTFNLRRQTISWQDTATGATRSIKLLAGKTYVRPSGYNVNMVRATGTRANWRLIGTVAEGQLCHKPSTVSGGGKSEISKAISNAILPGHVFIADFEKDFAQVAAIVTRDYSHRFRDPARNDQDHRPILSPERSLGSVIKLLTPSRRDYADEHNTCIRAIPQYIKQIVFILKRHYKPEWGDHWAAHFSVDTINGLPGYELKLDGVKLVTNNLRVGFEQDGSWRVFSLRNDFYPVSKVQMEDDITASIVAPAPAIKGLPAHAATTGSVKFVANCETLLFQRPDDAIHRGYDHQAETDIATPGVFLSNYEPLTQTDARALMEDAIGFNAYTEPMRTLIRASADSGPPRFFVSSAHPRLVDGAPSKNPRYLQTRPDLAHPLGPVLADLTARLHRRLPADAPAPFPVDILVPGRRNNPPEKGIRPLAVFNPIHHLELPELFMEFISSMTGKSPSTTGAGSEGALTKGPFNALLPIIDLNASLISLILTGHDAYLSAAGYVGPKNRVDHDISMLIPEVFARMTPAERSARTLIAEGCLEKCADFEHNGQPVLASRLGYRITTRFVRIYFGRVFNHPHAVFTDEMLRPEMQDLEIFIDGMDNICVTHKRVAESYFADGSQELAIPPLKALLHIMAHGRYEGKTLDDPAIRELFARENMLASPWYAERVDTKQRAEADLWRRHVTYLKTYLDRPNSADIIKRMDIKGRLRHARARLTAIESAAYPKNLQHTIGAQRTPI
jgi:hypothetical protein